VVVAAGDWDGESDGESDGASEPDGGDATGVTAGAFVVGVTATGDLLSETGQNLVLGELSSV
jgi:hypothetical protein